MRPLPRGEATLKENHAAPANCSSGSGEHAVNQGHMGGLTWRTSSLSSAASGASSLGTAMRARQLIAFGPDALKAIGEAFDAAWAEIADNFGNDPVANDEARYKLATSLLEVASEDSRDVDVRKNLHCNGWH
jgi:hypothetical protein